LASSKASSCSNEHTPSVSGCICSKVSSAQQKLTLAYQYIREEVAQTMEKGESAAEAELEEEELRESFKEALTPFPEGVQDEDS